MKLLGVIAFTQLTLLSFLGNVRGKDHAVCGKPNLLFQGREPRELAPHGLGNVYAPDVHFDNGIFRIWYGGLHVTRVGSRYVLVHESRAGTRMTLSDKAFVRNLAFITRLAKDLNIFG